MLPVSLVLWVVGQAGSRPPRPVTLLRGCESVRALSRDGSRQLVTVYGGQCAVHDSAGMHVIFPLPGFKHADAEAISGDGSTVVGFCTNAESPHGTATDTAFIWSLKSGTKSLTPVGAGWNLLSRAEAISEDGSTVVGEGISTRSKCEAFRWTAARAAERLGFIDFKHPYSWATCISRDGSLVGGSSATSEFMPADLGGSWTTMKAVVWDSAGRISALSASDSGRTGVRSISPSGNFLLVADKKEDSLWQGFKRTNLLPYGSRTNPRELLDDSPVVNGMDSLWTRELGWVSNGRILNRLRTWRLASLKKLTGIDTYSADLTVIVGEGLDNDNRQVVWLMKLPSGAIQQLMRAPNSRLQTPN